MEFISQLFVAFLSLFFGDSPFALDDGFIVHEKEDIPKTPKFRPAPQPFLLTPEMDRNWCPSFTSTPKPKRLFFVPDLDQTVAEKKIVLGPRLPLNAYLLHLEVTGTDTLHKAPTQVPIKRMGIRV
jgi:hypothetical protein